MIESLKFDIVTTHFLLNYQPHYDPRLSFWASEGDFSLLPSKKLHDVKRK